MAQELRETKGLYVGRDTMYSERFASNVWRLKPNRRLGHEEVAKILVADRNAASREWLAKVFSDAGHAVETISDSQSFGNLLARNPFDAAYFDWESFQAQAPSALEQLLGLTPDMIVVVLGEPGSAELVLRTLRSVHQEYLAKPFCPEEIQRQLFRALAFRRMKDEITYLRGETGIDSASPGSLGASPSMQEVHRLIARVATSQSPAVISGEAGTEKSEVAAAIHLASSRHDRPFIKYSCAGASEAVLEGDLFGSMAGHGPEGGETKRGIFERAEDGTVLLIECSRLPLPLQARLVRLLLRNEVVRVGALTPTRSPARVLLTTSEPLPPLVESGRFLEDLYDLLADLEIHLPPLRHRKEDIPHIALRRIERICRVMGIDKVVPEPEVLDELSRYPWPGNLTELDLCLERAILLGDRTRIRISDLPNLTPEASPTMQESLKLARRQFDMTHSNQILSKYGGDRIRTALALGVSTSTLYRILRPAPAASRTPGRKRSRGA